MATAIQTAYKGCLFRSRLEARWAVFFDNAKINWLYEPEGFVIEEIWNDENNNKKWNYLPDFYLPDTETWVEVKPDFSKLDDDYIKMLQWSIDWACCLPGARESDGTTRGLLMLSTIPYPEGYNICHPILQHYKGGYVNFTVFLEGGLKVLTSCNALFDATWEDNSGIKQALIDVNCYQHTDYQSDIIRNAYISARRSRFEFGDAHD